MSAPAVVVRRFSLSEMDKLAKKKAQEVQRQIDRKRAARVPKLAPLPPPPPEPVIELTPEQIERERFMARRAKIEAMIDYERAKPSADRLQLFEAYLELCHKLGELPDHATCASFERITEPREERA